MGYVLHNKALSSLYDFTVWLPFDDCGEHTGNYGKGHGFVQRFEDENALVASRAESLGLVNSRVIAGDNDYLVEVRFWVGRSRGPPFLPWQIRLRFQSRIA